MAQEELAAPVIAPGHGHVVVFAPAAAVLDTGEDERLAAKRSKRIRAAPIRSHQATSPAVFAQGPACYISWRFCFLCSCSTSMLVT